MNGSIKPTDPCPCGGGRFFFECHGAPNEDSASVVPNPTPRAATASVAPSGASVPPLVPRPTPASRSLAPNRASVLPAARTAMARAVSGSLVPNRASVPRDGCVIFLSHSSTDKSVAEELRRQLQRRGHHAQFLDTDREAGIPAGATWQKVILNRLGAASALVVLWSRNADRSKWVFAEVAIAQVLEKHVVIPVRLDDTPLPDVLSSLQALNVDPTTPDFSRLINELEKRGIEPRPSIEGRKQPYPGLHPFGEADAGVFCGRNDELKNFLEILRNAVGQRNPRLLLMLGLSGSGKSSLLRAGLTPKLRVNDQLVVIGPFNPGSDPIAALSSALAESLTVAGSSLDWRTIRSGLEQDADNPSAGTPHWVGWARDLCNATGRREGTVLIAVDQFEELFGSHNNATAGQGEWQNGTHAAASALDKFQRLMRAVLENGSLQTILLAALRSDFLDAFQSSPTFLDFPTYSLKLQSIGPLDPKEMRQAILFPAQLFHGSVEAELVEELVNDADGKYGLPLLANTLRKLWDSSADHILRLQDYERLGKLKAIITRDADKILHDYRDCEVDLRRAFVRMVHIDLQGRRTRAAINERDHLRASAALQKFVRSRLVVADEIDGHRVFNVAHEALFTVWNQLANWLRENEDFLRWHPHLLEQMDRADRQFRKAKEVLSDVDLDDAKKWLERAASLFSDEETEFVKSAIRDQQADEMTKQRAARKRKRLGVLAVTALVAFLFVALLQWRKAETARRETVAQRNEAQVAYRRADKLRLEEAAARFDAEQRSWDARRTQLAMRQTTKIAIDGEAEQVLCDGTFCWVAIESKRGSLARFKPGDLQSVQYFDVGAIDDMILESGKLWWLTRGSRRGSRPAQESSLNEFGGSNVPNRHIPLMGKPVTIAAGSNSILVLYDETESVRGQASISQIHLDGPTPTATDTLHIRGTDAPENFNWEGADITGTNGRGWVVVRNILARIGDTERPIFTEGEASHVTYDGRLMWVPQKKKTSVSLVDPQTAKVESLDTGVVVDSAFFDGRTVWLYSTVAGLLLAYDGGDPKSKPRTLLLPKQDIATTPLVKQEGKQWNVRLFSDARDSVGAHSRPRRIASDGAFLYVVNQDRDLYRVPLMSFPTNEDPSAILGTRSHLWIANRELNQVTRATYGGRYAGMFSVGKGPVALAYQGESIWVANQGDGTVSRLAEDDGRVLGTYKVGEKPVAMVADDRGVWVADWSAGAFLSFFSPTSSEVERVPFTAKPEFEDIVRNERPALLDWDGRYVWTLFNKGKWNLAALDTKSRATVGVASLDIKQPEPSLATARKNSDKYPTLKGTSGPPRKWQGTTGEAMAYDRRSNCLWTLRSAHSLAPNEFDGWSHWRGRAFWPGRRQRRPLGVARCR